MGRIEHEDLSSVLTQYDAFVFPSMAETFGFPMVEAMRAGVPLVVSDIPVHREVCGDAAAYFSFDYTFSNHFSIKAGSRIEQQRKKTYISYNQNYNCEDLIGTSNTSGFCNCIEYDTEGNCLETENSLFKYLLMDLGDDLKYNYAHKRFYPSLFLIYNDFKS